MNNKNERKIKRGDIYLYDFGDNEGSIQCGYRPVVVLQADNFNAKAPTIMVAAITTAIRKTFLPSHILVEDKYGLTEPSMIMLEQQRAINKDELVNYVGHIDDNNVLRKIHNGLMKLYGYWDYARQNKANIRCLCPSCLNKYKYLPELIVKRVDPLNSVKEKCDQCQGYGYDYFVYERSPRKKGGESFD